MAENNIDAAFRLKNTSVKHKLFSKPSCDSSIKKFKRNKWRILRRKRSKLKYWARRRELRIKRKSEELCETVSVFDITDMEMEGPQSQPVYVQPLEEVSAWQNRHQVAYWKSRAIALEYENRMLHKLLKNVHTRQIQEYAEYMQEEEQRNEKSKAGLERSLGRETHRASKNPEVHKLSKNQEFWEPPSRKEKKDTRQIQKCDEYMQEEEQGYEKLMEGHERFMGRETHRSEKREVHKTSKKQEFWEPPSEQARKEKMERMTKLYGNMAPKISGMETAIQLNYDLYIDKYNPPFWPNIPIKL